MKKKIFISFISFVLIFSTFLCSFVFNVSAAESVDYRIIDYNQYTNAFISVGVDGNKSLFYNYTSYRVPIDMNDGLSAFMNLQSGYEEGQVKNDMLTYQYFSTISGSYPNRVWGGRVWFSNNYSGYQNKPLSSLTATFLTIPKNYTLQYRLNFFLPAITYEQALKLQGSKVSIDFYIGPNSNDVISSECAVDYISRYRYNLAYTPYNQGYTSSDGSLAEREGVFVSFIGSVSVAQRSTINSIYFSITGLDHNWTGLLVDRMILFTNVYDNSFLGRVGSFFSSIGSTIGGFFTNLWSNLSNSLTNVTDWLYDIWKDLGIWFDGLTSSIGNFFNNLWNNISTAFDNVIQIISAPFHSWLDPIINIVNTAVNGFFDLARGIFNLSTVSANYLNGVE